MHTITLGFDAAWKVLAIGLLLGAGLPAVFALGVRALASGRPGAPAGDSADGLAGGSVGGPAGGSRSVGRLLGGLCFTLVLAAVVLGIAYIVASGFGYALTFEHVYPTFEPKK